MKVTFDLHGRSFAGTGHREEAERVELDADLLAHRAHERGLELTVEGVDDDAVVALPVVVPGLLRNLKRAFNSAEAG